MKLAGASDWTSHGCDAELNFCFASRIFSNFPVSPGGEKIFHFWATEVLANHVDTVWPYWNLMDFTPEGRPDIPTPPQNFRSEFLERNYLNKE